MSTTYGNYATRQYDSKPPFSPLPFVRVRMSVFAVVVFALLASAIGLCTTNIHAQYVAAHSVDDWVVIASADATPSLMADHLDRAATAMVEGGYTTGYKGNFLHNPAGAMDIVYQRVRDLQARALALQERGIASTEYATGMSDLRAAIANTQIGADEYAFSHRADGQIGLLLFGLCTALGLTCLIRAMTHY